MTDSSDMDVFDSITSGAAEANAPVIESNQEIIEPQSGQQRDENGRFATKADAPVIEHEQPAQIETPAENGNKVPVGAVQEERQKRQEAQRRADDLERQLVALQGQVTLLTQQRQPAPQTPQEVKQPATIWDDPDSFIQSQLSPVQQQMQEMREMMWESQAASAHTVEKLEAAKAAAQALAGTPAGQQLHSEIMAGGNPYSNLVKWHERQQTLATVGNDPQAWLNAELEKRMADPAFQAQVIERARGGAVQPGNRSQQPVTSIPPSLSRLPAGGNTAATEQESDAGMFASVTSGRRG